METPIVWSDPTITLTTYRAQQTDYRANDPRRPTTYVHNPTQVDVETKRTFKGPPGRRRKIVPLMVTHYLRYEALFSPPMGPVYLEPPGWSIGSMYHGPVITGTLSSILLQTKLLVNDPYYGDLVPQVSLAQRTAVGNEILKYIKSQSLDIGVAVAEAKQTLGFLATRASQAARAYEGLREKNWRKFRNAVTNSDQNLPPVAHRLASKRGWKRLPDVDPDFKSRTLAQNWLEYNYAVVPLLIDIDGAAKELADYFHYNPAPVAAKSYKTSWPIGIDEFTSVALNQRIGTHSWRFVGKMDYREQVVYRLDSERLKSLSRLGLTNPASVIWEKTKFSFLFDWLVPIGDFLSGWDATLGCTFIDGHATTYLQISANSSFTQTTKRHPIEHYPEGLISYKGWVRKRLRSFPYPSIEISNPYSPSHLGTVAALFKSIFRRGR